MRRARADESRAGMGFGGTEAVAGTKESGGTEETGIGTEETTLTTSRDGE